MGRPRTASLERFWAKVDRRDDDDCWPWLATLEANGYGRFYLDPERGYTSAHRAAYLLLVGPVPVGLVVDHLCENKSCVNPAHLEAVQEWVNLMRGRSPSAVAARKTHCIRGHPLSGSNLRIRGHDRARLCVTCLQARWRDVARRRREAIKT